MAIASSAADEYPIKLDVTRAEHQSRLTNFPLWIGDTIRLILLIPHFIILYFFQIAAQLVYLIATFAILFTGRYPEGLRQFFVGYLRWTANVYGYLGHLHDAYPPFGIETSPDYPMVLIAQQPVSLSRLLNFPFLGLVIKMILLTPHFIILIFLVLAATIVIFLATFAILFSGSFPEGMHRFVVGVGRWYIRATAYMYGLTDKYPPFSTN
jgi:hypothetical protein